MPHHNLFIIYFNASFFIFVRADRFQKPCSLIWDMMQKCHIKSTKVKHHLNCFNNIFSNNGLISNRFAVFVTCTHILTYLCNRLLVDFYLWGMLLTVHVQVDLAKRCRERTGSYPDGRGKGRSVQLVHF